MPVLQAGEVEEMTKKTIRASELREKLSAIRTYMNARVLEREIETDSALISILSGASCLLIGDAGAAKTYHIEILCRLLGMTLFDTLISQSTKPEQIFGPVDVPALAMRYCRRRQDTE